MGEVANYTNIVDLPASNPMLWESHYANGMYLARLTGSLSVGRVTITQGTSIVPYRLPRGIVKIDDIVGGTRAVRLLSKKKNYAHQ